MNRVLEKAEDGLNNRKLMFILGLLGVIVLYLPVMMLGKDALFVMHDQLDGEVLTYILRAKHFGETVIPEIFNGVSTTAMTPASVGTLVFYFFLPPFTAFVANYIFVAVCAYIGMYLCVQKMFERSWLSVIIAVIFSILPFYSVYGLSVMGQPLLVYAGMLLYENKKKSAYTLIAFFAVFSSLVLVGYADIFILVLITIGLWVKKEKCAKNFGMAMIELIIMYVVIYFRLLYEMLVPSSGVISHKTEIIISAKKILVTFKELLMDGQYHAASEHRVIMYYCIALCLVMLCVKCNEKIEKTFYYFFGILLFSAIAIAVFHALWTYWPIVEIRNKLGGIFVSFQADRFYWLYPVIWYLLLAMIIYYIYTVSTNRIGKYIVCMILLLWVAKSVYKDSLIKVNFDEFVFEDKKTTEGFETWRAFYSEELFENIKQYIGKSCNEYKVASIGVYPSVALFNGFYCIDAYSSTYDLEYKHEFRKIIEPELEKNMALKNYFDNWGNRCYVFVDQIPFCYQIQKTDERVLTELDLNTEQMKKMKCDYIFSALPIDSPKLDGKMEFCEKFTSDESNYAIYLYKIL